MEALRRRAVVSRLLRVYPLRKRGSISAIAAELGVAVCTVSRDVKAILRMHPPCPECGAPPIIGRDEAAEDRLDDATSACLTNLGTDVETLARQVAALSPEDRGRLAALLATPPAISST